MKYPISLPYVQGYMKRSCDTDEALAKIAVMVDDFDAESLWHNCKAIGKQYPLVNASDVLEAAHHLATLGAGDNLHEWVLGIDWSFLNRIRQHSHVTVTEFTRNMKLDV